MAAVWRVGRTCRRLRSPTVRRALAAIVAVGMVVGALLVRSRVDDNRERKHTVLRLVCAEELEQACDAIQADPGSKVEVTVEPAGDTEARLAKQGGADVDGWLVPAPWAGLVDEVRARNQLPARFGSSGAPIARSPLVIAMWADRAAALRAACGGQVGWKCIGDHVGPPTSIKATHADPTTSATGLLVLGQAVASFFGRADLSTTDVDASDPFDGWFAGLEQSVPPFADDPFDLMLVQGRSFADAVGTTEAKAKAVLADRGGSDVTLLYPSPMATADLVLAPVAGRDRAATLAGVVRGAVGRRALADAGWQVPGPAGPFGLPSPGFLDALRQRWREVVR